MLPGVSGQSILSGRGSLFSDLDGITGLVIGDLKPQKFVDGLQCFFVLRCDDPHSAATINVFILILQLCFQRPEHRHTRWDLVMDKHWRFEVTGREHTDDMG